MHAPDWHLAFRFCLVLLFAAAGPISAAEPVTLHVAPNGKGGWSGTLASPKADGTDGPLPSIEAARDAIRARRAKGEWKGQPVTVSIRNGTYALERPLEFTADDSGAAGAPVTYAAEAAGKVIISGGVAITGWAPDTLNNRPVWSVTIPKVKDSKWYFRQLFVNGARRARTRLPSDGYYTLAGLPTTRPDTGWGEGQDQAAFKPGDLKKWENLPDVEVVALSLWIESHLPIAEVDEAARIVKFGKKSVFRLTNSHAAGDFSRYYVENVKESLDAPGEWYLDRPTGKLYYIPMPGETPESVQVVAPRLTQLMKISGATDLVFKGVAFEHVDWQIPPAIAGWNQASNGVPGAVVLEKAQRCRFEDCRVSHVSTYAVELLEGCQENHLVNCELTDLGGGGVKIGHHTSKTTVTNCDIGPGGLIHHAAVGVWIAGSGENTVTHNDIHDLYYTGVSVGWSWGYGCSPAARNIVEYNHIWNIGKGMLSDMGGIYTLGLSPGTRLCYNRIHDIAASSYGGWGIYNDEGSTGILIENNIVYRTTHGGYHQHYGCQNLVRNNVFAFAMHWQIQRSREEPHISFIFERNIVYWLAGPLLGSTWKNGMFAMDDNCYWRVDGKPIDFAGMTLEQWREKGCDVHSIIADPGFADPQGGDFTLSPSSPALKTGFRPIDTGKIGRQKR